jgi:hypothetical protein
VPASDETPGADCVEAAILRRLLRRSLTGEALSRLPLPSGAFAAAATRLWLIKALRGHLEDGCCNDGCGLACITALKPAMRWQLTGTGLRMARLLGSCDAP